MATKYYGTCTGTTGSKYDLWLEVTQNSQSVVNNTTNVTVRLKLKRNDGYSASAYNLYQSENTVLLSVGGTSRVNGNTTIDTRNGATDTLASWTGDVQHNSDGSLTLALSGSFTIDGADLRGGSVSATYKCTDIPRASGFTLSASKVNADQSVTVSISAKSSVFSHIVKYSAGSRSGSVSAAAGATSASFSIPASWFNSFTSSAEFTATITLETYKGTTLVGKSSKTLCVAAPDTSAFLPSFSISLSDVGSLPAGINGYVKGVSLLRVATQNLSFKYGATVKSVKVTVAGSTKNSIPSTFSLNTSGTVQVSVRITDSRNKVCTQLKNITVYNYVPPSLSITSIARCNSSGTVNNTGTYAKLQLTTKYSSVNSQNVAALKVKCRKSGETAVVEATYAIAGTLIIGGFDDITSSYIVEVSITDTFTTTPFKVTQTLASAYVPFNIRRGGRGASFGGYSDCDGELKVCYNLNVLGSLVPDTPPTFTPAACVSESNMEIKYFKCLGIVFMRGRLIVTDGMQSDTVIQLGTFGAPHPNVIYVVNAATNSPLPSKVTGHITADGVLTVYADRQLPSGVGIYVDGFWMNGGM